MNTFGILSHFYGKLIIGKNEKCMWTLQIIGVDA